MSVQLLTVAEVCDLLRVSKWFVYERGQELGLVKVGGANRYRAERVEQYLRDRQAQTERREPEPQLVSVGCRSKPSRRKRACRVPLRVPATGLRPGSEST